MSKFLPRATETDTKFSRSIVPDNLLFGFLTPLATALILRPLEVIIVIILSDSPRGICLTIIPSDL